MSKAADETRKLFLGWGYFDPAEVDAFIEESGLKSIDDVAAVRAAREVAALCHCVGRMSEAAGLVRRRATLTDAQAHLRQIVASPRDALQAHARRHWRLQ